MDTPQLKDEMKQEELLPWLRWNIYKQEYRNEWWFSADLRNFELFGSLVQGNHDIERLLDEAGLIQPGDNCKMTDTEYSCFYIYFESREQARMWASDLAQFMLWVNENRSLFKLAARYAELSK